MHRFYNQIILLTSLFSILTAASGKQISSMGSTDHGARLYRSPFVVGTALPSSPLPVLESNSTIYVRYLGYTCSHCVRQLTYLNAHADALRRMGIQVVAISTDDARTSQKMMTATGLNAEVIRTISDPENEIARSIGALREENDTLRDLHAVLVVRNGVLTFAAFTDEPFMDIERIVAAAAPQNSMGSEQGSPSAKGLRSYNGGFTVRTIAGPNDGVREPKDLAFNSSPLHPNDLWVVLGEPDGHAMLIVHDADKATQVIRRKKDYRASHFMWRTQALAFGTNGAFATAQNGEPGGEDRDYQFMGPTLWCSDTAIFASKYQEEDGRLASHLDMLHQNAYCLGIAHERDNVYWISDALHGTIGRYDFHDPHEVGGSDHRDGEIRNYTSAKLTSSEHGRPAHIAFDAEKRWLYFINPGANNVMRLDTRTGTDTRALSTTPFSDENLTSFREFTGSTVEPVVQLTKAVRPVGLDVDGNSLIIGNTDGTVLIYEILDKTFTLKHTLNVAPHVVGGLTVGPDGRIWFVDPADGTVSVIDPDVKETMIATDAIRVTPTAVAMTMALGIVRPNCDIASYLLTVEAPDGWTVSHPDTVTITASAPANFNVKVTPDSNAQAGYLRCFAKDLKGESVLSASVLISRSDIRRVIVHDATTEAFDMVNAVKLTSRKGYSPMSSELYLQLFDSIPDIQTVLWYSGSFGLISEVEDLVMQSLGARGREIFLIADDPLILRTDLPFSPEFFNRFGARIVGADAPQTDDGVRIFHGVPNDPISGAMSRIECQLPRLDHEHGTGFVPNIQLAINKPGSFPVLNRSDNTITSVIRYNTSAYRTVLCGVNPARFLDAEERTMFLDRSLQWLEEAETKLPDPTDVEPQPEQSTSAISIVSTGANPFAENASVHITATTPHATVMLYAITGQRIATLWNGAVEGSADLVIDGSALSNGSYYVVLSDASTSAFCTLIKRK